jgi:hypothetical protein
MGLLKKKKKTQRGVSDYKLPELPDLPEFPSVDSPPKDSALKENESLPKLPSFPNNNIGNKFSQDSIKEAVTGNKEVVEEDEDADDFSLPGLPERHSMMHEPLKPVVTRGSDDVIGETKSKPKEFHREVASIMAREEEPEPEYEQKPFRHTSSQKSRVYPGASARDEPVFIRIDKFEESLKVFEKTREQIKELEDLVKHAKDLKNKEEEELSKWEEEIQIIKDQIGKVDRDIFSKLE